MKKDEITAFCYNPNNGVANDTQYTFKSSDVRGITMAPDGTTYANLRGFRQARIRVNDYFNLKEEKFPWTKAPSPK